MDHDSHYDITMPKIWQPWRCDDLIRLGKDNDGGYLVSHSDVIATKQLVSFGIGCDWIFEQQFMDLAGCPLAAFDEKIPPQCDQGLREWFQGSNRQFTETKICASGQASGMSIQQCVQGQDVFLKCDIEGGEFDILDDILSMGDIWTGMAFEIHNIDQWEKYNHITAFISKIPLKLLHLHVNNWGYWKDEPIHMPWVYEITLGRGKNTRFDPAYTLPHPSDMPNNAQDHEFSITF